MNKVWAALGLGIGLAGLILQFGLTIPSSMANGRSLPGALVYFFSFFTIQTNIILVLVYAAHLFRNAGWLRFFARPVVAATAAAMIALVMGFYHFILRPTWAPEGVSLVADVALHYIAPLVYLGWFALFGRSGTLAFSALPKMLIYPAIYIAYIMGRGALIGEYPYPTFEANIIGYGEVALNTLILLIILSVLNAVAVVIDRAGTPKREAS